MGYIEEKQTVTKKIKVLPCVKCGSENINLGDCGYSSFNVAWGKCLDCKHEVKINPCDWNINKAAIAKVWNKANNPKILKAEYQRQISELQKKIDNLPT
jgi:hypothetical protein